jgi:hypothetical protein
MNRSVIAALVAATTTFVATTATSAHADFVPEPARAPAAEAPKANVPDPLAERFALHLDPVVLIPFGALSDATGIGAGAMLGGEYRVSSSLSFTGRVGYISGVEQQRNVAGFQLASSIDTAASSIT